MWFAAGPAQLHDGQDLGGDSVQLPIVALVGIRRPFGSRPKGEQVASRHDQQHGLLDPVGSNSNLVGRKERLGSLEETENGKRKTEN